MARRRSIFNVNVDLGRRRREEESEEEAIRSEAAERAHRVRQGIVGEEVAGGTFRAEQPQQPETFGQAAVNMPRSQEGKMAEQLLPGSSGLLERQAKRNAEKIEAQKSQVAHDQVITNVNTVDKIVATWMKVMKSEASPQVKKAMTDQTNLSFTKILGAKGLKFEYTDDWGTGKEKYHEALRTAFIGASKLFVDAAPNINSERILTQKYKELIDSAANYKRITKDDPSGTMDLVNKLFTEGKARIRKPAMDKIAEAKRLREQPAKKVWDESKKRYVHKTQAEIKAGDYGMSEATKLRGQRAGAPTMTQMIGKEKFGIQKGQTASGLRADLVSGKNKKDIYEESGFQYNNINTKNEIAYWDSKEGFLGRGRTKITKLSSAAIKAGWTPKKIQEAATRASETIEQVLTGIGMLR